MGFVVCVAALWLHGDAHAQPAEEPTARALFDEGRRLVERGQYGPACAKFEAARRLTIRAGLIFHLADCYEKLGRMQEARVMFDEAARVAARTGRADVATEAERRRDAAAPPPPAPSDGPHPPPPAASEAEVAARALFEDGRRLRDSGATEAACEKFAAAWARFASAGVAFNLGDCYARLGRTSSALSAFRDAATQAAQTNRPDLVDDAQRRMTELMARSGQATGERSTSNQAASAAASAPTAKSDAASLTPPRVAAPTPIPSADQPPAPLPAEPAERSPSKPPGVEWFWIDADLGGTYAQTTRFDTAALAVQHVTEGGPTFSAGAGLRLDFLTLGVRVRDLDLSAFSVWEVDGEAALHTRLDRFDGHVGLRIGYAFTSPLGNGSPPATGFNVGGFFGFDYYVSGLVSLGLQVAPEVLVLRSAAQSSAGLGLQAVARAGLHF